MMSDGLFVTLVILGLVVLPFIIQLAMAVLFNKARHSVRQKLDQHAQERENEEQPDGERLADRYKDIEK